MPKIPLRKKALETKEKPRKDFSDMSTSFENAHARFEEVVSRLPEDIQLNLLNEFVTQSLAITIPPPVLLSPLERLKENYKQFPQGRKRNAENIIAHLRIELKDYVKAFGANDNYIYLNDFRKIEKQADTFEKRLSEAHQKSKLTANPVPKLSDIIPTVSVRIKKQNQAIAAMEQSQRLSFTLNITY